MSDRDNFFSLLWYLLAMRVWFQFQRIAQDGDAANAALINYPALFDLADTQLVALIGREQRLSLLKLIGSPGREHLQAAKGFPALFNIQYVMFSIFTP